MNKIDDLIAKLCPNGVEYKELQELFFTKNGYTPRTSNKEFWENGTIPWFKMEDIRINGKILSTSLQKVSASAVKSGKLFPKSSIIIATSATIGEHALITVPYIANQRFTALVLKQEFTEKLDIKFIFYYCFKLDVWCCNNITTSSFASVDMNGFKKFKFPVPPLEIQREIVKILDTFTKLEARRRQYHYYRDQLLNFEGRDDVQWMTVGEVTKINTGQKPSNILEVATDFEYINAGTSRSGYCVASNCEGDTVTTPSRGQGGIGYVGYQKKPFWLGPLCYKLQSLDNDILINKYLFYVLQSKNELLLGLKKEGGVPAVNKSDIIKLEIPVPPLEEQTRIVTILDKFDALVNDLSCGLPAEIAARRKQYAYYRDRLLTFKEAQ